MFHVEHSYSQIKENTTMSTVANEILPHTDGKSYLEKKIKKEAERIRKAGRAHASEELKSMALELYKDFNTTQKEICDLTGWSKGVVSKWINSITKKVEETEIKLVEDEENTSETSKTTKNQEENTELSNENSPEAKPNHNNSKSGLQLLYALGGTLSFLYLLNAEMNFYMSNDIETFSFIPIPNATFWISMLKSAVVLSGILISLMANKKKLLILLSSYTFAVSIIVGWHNHTQIETKKKEKEEQNISSKARSQNKTLFEMKDNIETRINKLNSRIDQEQKYKKIHTDNKAYGHVERCDKNITYLESKITSLENKKHEVLSKIDSRIESLRHGMAVNESAMGLWVTYLVSVLMKLFALFVKITSFSKLATGLS